MEDLDLDSNLYIVKEKTIIFDPEYNLPFSDRVLEILSNYNTIIFDEIISEKKIVLSKFNQSVGNLPNSIRDITFGFSFNQTVDSIPNSVIALTFGSKFNQSVNNLPNSIRNIT
jgi:hypothetical protein